MYKTLFVCVGVLLCQLALAKNQAVTSIQQLEANGYYTQAINVGLTALKAETNRVARGHIFAALSDCYYYAVQIENQLAAADSAHKYLSNFYTEENIYEVAYLVRQQMYYNYHIRPTEAAPLGIKALALLKKHWKDRFNINLYTVHLAIGTTLRNSPPKIAYGINAPNTYTYKINWFDTAYMYLKEQGLQNTIHDVYFQKSCGNYHLDCIDTDDPDMFATRYKQAQQYYQKGLTILARYYPENKPIISQFYCLWGLAHYTYNQYSLSNQCYNLAFKALQQTNNNHVFNDYKTIYLNLLSWSALPVDALYKQNGDINTIKQNLALLKQSEPLFLSYINKNKDKEFNLFLDKYIHTPYNSIVSYYHHLFKNNPNEAYIDSALYYAEKGKMLWISDTTSFDGVQHLIANTIKNNDNLVVYSQLGLRKDVYLYAIIITPYHKQIVKLDGNSSEKSVHHMLPEANEAPLNWLKKRYYTYYLDWFKPLEQYLDKNRKLWIIPSGMYNNFAFEALVTDTLKELSSKSFLFNQYHISQQIALQYTRTTTQPLPTGIVNTFLPDFLNSNYPDIPFTKNVFDVWSEEYKKKELNFNTSNSSDISLIATHTNISNIDVHDNYILTPDSSIDYTYLESLKNKTQLAVLASCQGGKSHENLAGAHQYNLAHTFIKAGANACIYSNWSLDDKSASEILQHFLTNISNGVAKDEALRLAKQKYLSEITTRDALHPVYWANLQLAGYTNPVVLKKKTTTLLPLVAGGIIVIFGFILFFTLHKMHRQANA